jgi:2-alkyl-3-oxoalkanoate reductase
MGTDDRRAAGLSLRYGFFYGPGTWYHRDGALAREIREGRMPIVGDGLGRWSWVHVDDAVVATLAALEQGRGVLNVCDDEPAAMADWLPHAASVLGAEPPPRMPTSLVHKTAGPDLVHYGTRMPGASNARAKAALSWIPAWPSWRGGFEQELGDSPAQAVPGRLP